MWCQTSSSWSKKESFSGYEFPKHSQRDACWTLKVILHYSAGLVKSAIYVWWALYGALYLCVKGRLSLGRVYPDYAALLVTKWKRLIILVTGVHNLACWLLIFRRNSQIIVQYHHQLEIFKLFIRYSYLFERTIISSKL